MSLLIHSTINLSPNPQSHNIPVHPRDTIYIYIVIEIYIYTYRRFIGTLARRPWRLSADVCHACVAISNFPRRLRLYDPLAVSVYIYLYIHKANQLSVHARLHQSTAYIGIIYIYAFGLARQLMPAQRSFENQLYMLYRNWEFHFRIDSENILIGCNCDSFEISVARVITYYYS